MFALYGGHYFDFNRRYDTASATLHCNNIQIYSQGGFEHIYELPFLRFKKICSMNSNSATQYPGYLLSYVLCWDCWAIVSQNGGSDCYGLT